MPAGGGGRYSSLITIRKIARGGKEFPVQLGIGDSGTAPFYIHDEIEVMGNLAGGLPKDFPEQALHAVSDDSASNLAGNCDSQAVVTQAILPSEENEVSRVQFPACIVYGSVIR